MMLARPVSFAAILVPLVPLPVWAVAAETGDESGITRLFFVLGIMLLAGKLSGEVFERIGQPAVLGELIAGVALGVGMLDVIPTASGDPLTSVVQTLAEIGVVVLLFEIGLQTDLKQLFRVGRGASAVAVVGVTVPFLLGFAYWLSPLVGPDVNVADRTLTAIFVGATMTATSVGITARVLSDMNLMRTIESQLIIGAAVIDDVLGLVILGLVSSLAAGVAVSGLQVGRSLAVAVGFLVVAVAVGVVVAPKIFGIIDRMRVRGVLLVSAFSFTLFLSALADVAGSAMIIGAFAAGLILSGTNQFEAIEERIRPVADIVTPIFFLSVGAQLDVRLLNPLDPANLGNLGMGLALLALGVVGKVIAGWAVPWRRYNRATVGLGMMPRGEVGLIFANVGLTAAVFSTGAFGAILIMVVGSTLVAPPLLKWSVAKWGSNEPPAA